MSKKYSMKKERNLYRITALKTFGSVKEGTVGGLIKSEDNLSHKGNCWITNFASVYGYALVTNNAKICGSLKITSNVDD